jgi:hypothetical protein
VRVLHDEPKFSELFMAYLLARNARVEEDPVEQLVNSSETRLARVLLLMANFELNYGDIELPNTTDRSRAAQQANARCRGRAKTGRTGFHFIAQPARGGEELSP